MADPLTEQQRSEFMSRVRTQDTEPELVVRKLLHGMGYRYSLHRRDLPGTPDIVLPRHRKIVFVHGCFWHNHDCPRGRRPSTRRSFWDDKLDRNVVRDRESQEALEDLGWEVLVVWECELKDREALIDSLANFMASNPE